MLRLEDVSFSYAPGRRVLEGVSVQAEAGRVTAVVGPNGAGKSTLLRLAAGLLMPDEGSVFLDGRDTRTLGRREAARLSALAAADPLEDTPLSVRQLLYDAAFVWESAFFTVSSDLHERVRSAAEHFELNGLLERALRELSSGERGRLALARAVVQNSALLLLDEPSGRLDYRHREILIDEVKALASAGKAIVAVEHNLEIASRLADTIVALRNGRVVASGAAATVLTTDTLEKVYGVRFEMLDTRAGSIPLPVGVSEKPSLDILDSMEA